MFSAGRNARRTSRRITSANIIGWPTCSAFRSSGVRMTIPTRSYPRRSASKREDRRKRVPVFLLLTRKIEPSGARPGVGTIMRFILMFLIAVGAIVAAAVFLYYGPLAVGAADACEPADLSASAKWQTSDPLSGSIRFLNQSEEACSLRGKPELRPQDAATGSLNVSSSGGAAFGRTELAPGETAAASAPRRTWW